MSKNITGALVIILVLAGGLALFSLNKDKRPETGNGPTQTENGGADISLVAGPVVGSVKSSLGEYLTDTKGMTLYVYADDKKLKSSCAGDCLKKWPPFMYDDKGLELFTDVLSKRMNVIKRDDGSYQYAYGEKPVYYYAGDDKPGDTLGNGLNAGKWSIVPITN